jgi:hypothetical protein
LFVADLLERIRKELDVRIRELRPVAREYERLERAAAAIGRPGRRPVPGLRSRADRSAGEEAASAGAAGKQRSRAAAATPTQRTSARPRPGTTPRRTAAQRGQTQAKVLAALDAAPGSSPTVVAKASGVSANVAAATLSRLAKQGRVQRLERGGYAVVEMAVGRPSGGEPSSTPESDERAKRRPDPGGAPTPKSG